MLWAFRVEHLLGHGRFYQAKVYFEVYVLASHRVSTEVGHMLVSRTSRAVDPLDMPRFALVRYGAGHVRVFLSTFWTGLSRHTNCNSHDALNN